MDETTDDFDLAALVGSRICHDLINPMGAIGNGVELLSLTGAAPGPELALVAESVGHAAARLKYFRIAFGASAPGQQVTAAEIAAALPALATGRLSVDWQAEGALPRAEARLAMLLLLCLESALPYGGQIAVLRNGAGWTMTGSGQRLRDCAPGWDLLRSGSGATPPAAAEVHFLLAARALARLGRPLRQDHGPDAITLGF